MFSRLFEPFLRQRRRQTANDAITAWPREQTACQAQFLAIAETSGTPRGLLWTDCEWTGDIRFVRERTTNLLTAFAGVVVRFEAIEGDEMEDVPAVTMPRDAVAVFHYRSGHWDTDGRTLFNMTPDEASERFAMQFEPIEV